MANPGSEHPEHSEESSLKEKIFQSAIALFAEYGLNGARMEQIAEKAGTTKRMVVYHLKIKRISISWFWNMFTPRFAPVKKR